MTEPKWTPGPHFVEIMRSQIPESEDADITFIIADKDKNEIVTFYNESDEALANAQLYAAAPDMYEATDWVDKLVEAFGECSGSQYSLNLPGAKIRAMIDARRKAKEGK